jgi:hypothetical protein
LLQLAAAFTMRRLVPNFVFCRSKFENLEGECKVQVEQHQLAHHVRDVIAQ